MPDVTGDSINDINMTNTTIGGQASTSRTVVNGAVFQIVTPSNSGTGGYNTFLAFHSNGSEAGFNSDDAPTLDSSNSQIDHSKTNAVLIADMPVTIGTGTGPGGNGGEEGVAYYEIRLDVNESDNTPLVSLDQLKIYTSTSGTIENLTVLQNTATPVYNLDAGGDVSLLLSSDVGTGSGTDDYVFLIPVSAFGDIEPDETYMYFYTQMGVAGAGYQTDGGFEEFNLQNAVTLSGIKFNDIDSSGTKNGSEGNLDGFTMELYRDANGNGVLDGDDQLVDTTVTANGGTYSFFSVAIANTYFIKEVSIPINYQLTTGEYETVVIGDKVNAGTTVSVPNIGNHLLQPAMNVVKTVSSITDTNDFGAMGQVDSVGDTINYSITIDNTGDVALTVVSVTDQVEAYASGPATAVLQGDGVHNVGDVNDNNLLDVDETWSYTASYVVQQADIDAAYAGDGTIDNVAVGDTDQTDPDSDDESVEVVFVESIDVTKDVVSVIGGDDNNTVGDLTDDRVDSAGDTINYSITIENTGNVALSGVSVTDQVEAYASGPATAVLQGDGVHNIGDLDDDNLLDADETWSYTAAYVVQQADIDAAYADDGDIDNVAVGDTDETDPDSDSEAVTVLANPEIDVVKSVVSVTGGDDNNTVGDLTDDLVDSAGDTINYSITIENTGNVTLSGVSVDDQVEAYASGAAAAVLQGDGIHNIGDVNDNNMLDVDETWTYTAAYVVQQADIDNDGGGDGSIDNVATGDTDQTDPDSDDASVPIIRNPAIDVVKAVVSVDGGDDNNTVGDLTDDLVDSAGDTINYSITIENTGNVTLSGVSVDDQVEAYASGAAAAVLQGDGIHNIGDVNDNNMLDVDETWTYTAAYVVQQADIDNDGGGDGSIDNVATGDTDQTDPDSDDASVPIIRDVSVDLEKLVSVTGIGGTYVDADTAPEGPQNFAIGAPVFFTVTVENTGNVTLVDPLITDVNTSNGGNSSITLYDGATDTLLAGVDFSGDDNLNGNIDVGETWTFIYSQPFDVGEHVNTATVVTTGVMDSDAANYFSVVDQGPGVRTPGFWAHWTDFWDGDPSVPKQAGQPGFPEYDLLRIDSDGDGDIDSNDSGYTNQGATPGLLIGDYNRNGVTDGGEDTLFISLTDAVKLLTGKEKDMSDGVVKIGRDVVATWLNYLEGNGIGLPTDDQSPHHFIDDAIDYLQMFGDADPNTATDDATDTFAWVHGGVKTSTALWTGTDWGVDHSGAQIHAALDYYNNTGMTSPGGIQYAPDADSLI